MEESLKTMLHCDDKEKLKERLAILQREYNRTVQRLKRAERSEAVRKHVRNKLAEQNLLQEGQYSGLVSEPDAAQDKSPCSINESGLEDQKQSPSVRFRLPHDVLWPCSNLGVMAGSSESLPVSDTVQGCSPGQQDASLAAAEGPQRRSAHRLRSRRSRLRWESRERNDSGVSDTENSEDGRDPTGYGERETSQIHVVAGTSTSEAVTKPAPDLSGDAVQEADNAVSQDQVPGNVPVSADLVEHGGGRVMCDPPILDIRTAPVLDPPWSSPSTILPPPSPSVSDAAGSPSGPARKASTLDLEAPTEEKPQPSVARPALDPDTPGTGYLDSCTLVEGLLFPVEYYVRTTRRMSASQSSVDLGAVIQSQLSGSRMKRGRGRRGRAGSATPRSGSRLAVCKDMDSVDHLTLDSENSPTLWSSPATLGPEPSKPIRGGRRRGGRRGRRGMGPKRGHAPSGASPLGISSATAENLRTDSVPTAGTDSPSRPAEKNIYPIFCTKSQLTAGSSPKIPCGPIIKGSSQNAATECLRDGVEGETLLLPASPEPQRPHVLTLGGGHLSLQYLLSHLDAKEFHLPDDEFGMLKRDKLRTSTDGDLEAFVPHRCQYATRQRVSGAPLSSIKKKRLRSARALSPSACQQLAQPEGKPAGSVSRSPELDLESERDAAKSLASSLVPCEVTHKEAGQSCDSLPLERGNGPEHIAGGCAEQEDGMRVAQKVKSEGSDSDVSAKDTATNVLHLSPTQTAPQTPKSTTLALPSWGSPSFPSLGVTPAFPLSSRPPTQQGTLSVSLQAQSPCSPTTSQPTAHCIPPQGPLIRSQPNTCTKAPSLSCVPTTEGHSQSLNVPCIVQNLYESQKDEHFADRDPCAADKCSPDARELLMSYSFSSLCQRESVSPSSHNPAVSTGEEQGCNRSSPCPSDVYTFPSKPPASRRVLLPPRSPEREGAEHDGAETSFSTPAKPSNHVTDRKGEALAPTVPGSCGEGCPDADVDEGCVPLAFVQEEDFNNASDPRKLVQGSPSASHHHTTQGSACITQLHSDTQPGPDTLPRSGTVPGQDTLLSSSAKLEDGDKDLDCYFTDSAWSRGARTPSQSGHNTWGHSPAEKRPDTPPPSPHTLSRSLKLMHTLKATAGRCLVDVCSVNGTTGWCVVTAEEWEVCVWGQSSSQQWSLLHVWTFTEYPVISLLPVPDSHGLLCISLGKLEIREVRIMSCFGAIGQLPQSVLCTGDVQAVLGLSGARVACCSTSTSKQTIQVFTLSEEGSPEDSLFLVSPEQSVQALAAVDGQTDALIGSTDSSHLVLWNIRTGHLLQRFLLAESLSGTVCLRGYSEGGVLFVLLQQRFLHNVNLDEGAPFCLIATNPVTAKSVLVQHLARPSQCIGRFTEGDVCESAVVAVFQAGSLAVWDLRDSDCGASLACGPEEGYHVVRWGGPNTLLAGHINGDILIYKYMPLELF
ncbi:hypothetical protein GJAV_G00263540 [Gymnothorax javanicus]|nr:hypothetical protein GJAV_G00263540 [Gymnothorax javanicus]